MSDEKEERAKRKEYLQQMNVLLGYAKIILNGTQGYATLSWCRDDLETYEKISTLRQAAKVEKIGWELMDYGTDERCAHAEIVGAALVHTCELYSSRCPLQPWCFEGMSDHLEKLKNLSERVAEPVEA